MLKDLNILAHKLQSKYLDEFDYNQIQLSDLFKDLYRTFLNSISLDITYTDYTATIITTENKKMYIPNQWFRAALYMVPYMDELIKYKKLITEIIKPYNLTSKDEKDYFTKMKNGPTSADIEEFKAQLNNFITANQDSLIDIDTDIDLLISFISNYHWWYGSKTIDRGDYYVSPILNLLGVLNVSQGYIADICYHISTNLPLKNCAEQMIIQNKKINTLTNSSIRKTGGINLIVYGAPGTGKSRFLEERYGCEQTTRRVVFHSEYTYYDFVGVYKPTPIYKQNDSNFFSLTGQVIKTGEPFIDYKFVPGPFIKVLINAWLDPENMHTLLIEEINRADAASVFGEIFQLLDRSPEGVSEYKLKPQEDLMSYILSIEGLSPILKDGIYLPSNMNIVATMNSSDQGVKPMDSAFKRRWSFYYIKINTKGTAHEKVNIRYAGQNIHWGDFVGLVNKKLCNEIYRLDEDKLIGPYFIKPSEIKNNNAIDKLLLYLWDDLLRHCRKSFFNKEIKTFSELTAKFTSIDALSILDNQDSVKYLFSNEEFQIEDELNEPRLE